MTEPVQPTSGAQKAAAAAQPALTQQQALQVVAETEYRNLINHLEEAGQSGTRAHLEKLSSQLKTGEIDPNTWKQEVTKELQPIANQAAPANKAAEPTPPPKPDLPPIVPTTTITPSVVSGPGEKARREAEKRKQEMEAAAQKQQADRQADTNRALADEANAILKQIQKQNLRP
jgi:hypothetical protein